MPQGRVAVQRVCVFFLHCARLCESADAQNSRQLLCIQTKVLKKTKQAKQKSHAAHVAHYRWPLHRLEAVGGSFISLVLLLSSYYQRVLLSY